ncbi:MAG: 2'-5' RNA ligase [Candidatus Roizmanbacteria bacterium GW2011_GWA2_34_18]|uniref:RNA 2',3'-cyclic phosphodiesterase n=1 Tax=Candidatus Roizmanbacteria bacterium GW2011_GWA2_34_18 TaxID=1618477 RepID=A0A0G0E110_9BACT|nr:MAG: 2'-5' RNA ligase [Candidatus Roizmanbacteria bacterium GW2011_GWA2_34_18]
MRLFLAIELSDKIKKEIDDQLLEIKKTYPQFQWVSSDNYHITIHFFGEISDHKKIINKLEQVLYDKESFYFYSTSVDLFIHHKITINLDFRREKKIEKINDSIKEIFKISENSVRFIPHLTLARYKIPSKQQYFVLKKRLAKVIVDISFKINKLVLFESILSGSRSVYKKIHTFKLL